MGLDRVLPETPPQNDQAAAAMQLLLLSIKTISQRALIALSNLFTVAAVGSTWWLFNAALPINPSANQLIGLGLYGVFVLAIHWVRR